MIAALKKLSDSGVRLFFTHGNRDFLIGKQFARESGATLLPDHHLAELGGQRVLLLHGDTLCTGDADYQKFRRRYRHPLVKFLLRHLPLKKRPPPMMISQHIWAMSHGIVELFARGEPGARSPFSPEELLETGTGIYLRGLGILPEDQ